MKTTQPTSSRHASEVLTARLPHPVSANRVYPSTTGSARWYKTHVATSWSDRALLTLRTAGFRVQPAGRYRVELDIQLYTASVDLDNIFKLLVDLIKVALGVDDRWVARITGEKTFAPRAEQRVEVRATITEVKDKREWNALGIVNAS
jgi:Holliday junction resolvase RusA-like endonuclease